jgi:hypothetical protein
VASTIYAGITAALLIASYNLASRHFIYPLDDTYINMAVAKNFAAHGVWGVTPFEFSSSSSTPFFILVLSAVYRLTGPSQYVPLGLSWLFGFASIYAGWQFLEKNLDKKSQTSALVAFVLLPPLFVVGTLGMEHSLHLLLTLLFVQQFDADGESIWPVSGITILMVITRYEGLFMASVAFLLLAYQRRWIRAMTIAVSAALPVGAYALFSISHHGYWLPNSIALKGAHAHLRDAIINSLAGAHLSLLLVTLTIITVLLRRVRPKLARAGCLVAGAGCLHLILADVGWAWRYEDYLISCGVLVVASAIPQLDGCSRLVKASLAIFLGLAGGLLASRALQAGISLPKYSRAIYLQQWQMANFLRACYPGAAIAANDIGAITFRTDVHLLDLVGLANSDVFIAKRAGTYSTQFIDDAAKKRRIEIAVIYDSWFSPHPRSALAGPPVPSSWIRVRRWRVPVGELLGDDTVSFYALTPAEAAQLGSRLDAFASTALPKNVTVTP